MSMNEKSVSHSKNMHHPKASKKKVIKRILFYLKDYKAMLAFVMVAIFVSAFSGVLGSMFLRTLIDDYINPLIEQTVKNYAPLAEIIMYMAGIYLLGVVATYVFNRLMASVSQGGLDKIRKDMFSKMQRLPLSYFDSNAHGDIMSKYTNDIDSMRELLSQVLPQVFSTIITLVALLAAMFAMNWLLTLVVIASVGAMMFVIKFLAKKSGKFFMLQQKTLGAVNGYIEEMMNGQKVVKVFCHEEKSKEGFNKLNEELFINSASANAISGIFMPVMNNLGTIQYILLALVGGILIITNANIGVSVTVGVIASFMQLSKSFTSPIIQVSQQLNFLVMALAGGDRIFEMMDQQPETDEGYVGLVNAEIVDGEIKETDRRTELWAWKHPHKENGSITYSLLKGDIEFENVDFGYVPEKMVLKNLTLHANPGKKIAFVGSTGAGKTTITNLINRFYDISAGKIRYDGINIKKIKKDDLRRSLGTVLQDTNLFTGTVRENIRFGRLDATDEEVEEAAKLANADDFITRLPNGYDTELTGDGANLSQGQRQLLSIARAAVADAPVMIMDEATSSIDTRTEILVQNGTDKLMHGRTVFVIAHRLSTIRNSDLIVVLEHGEIIESGNHEELLKLKGRYYQLYYGSAELN